MLVLGCPFCWNNMDRIVANVLAEDYKTVLELSCLTAARSILERFIHVSPVSMGG